MTTIEVDITQRRYIEGTTLITANDPTMRLVAGDIVTMVDAYGDSLGAARVHSRREFSGKIGTGLFRTVELEPLVKA